MSEHRMTFGILVDDERLEELADAGREDYDDPAEWSIVTLTDALGDGLILRSEVLEYASGLELEARRDAQAGAILGAYVVCCALGVIAGAAMAVLLGWLL